MAGKRNFKGPILGLSIYSSYISNLAIISLPAIAFQTNWQYILYFIWTPFSAYFVARYMIPVYRKHGSISAYQILSDKFGRWAGLYASLCYFLTNITRLAIIMYLVAITLTYLTGLDSIKIVFMVGGIAAIYTSLGGIRSVIWTDALQALIMMTGITILLFCVHSEISGSTLSALALAHSKGKLSLGNTNLTFISPSLIALSICGIVSQFQGLATEQGFVQRYIVAKSDRDAKVGLWLGVALIMLTILALFVTGTLFTQISDIATTPSSNQYIVLEFLRSQNPLVIAILILTIVAAAMSSIDTEINAISTLIYSHIYVAYFKKKRTSNFSMQLLCWSSLLSTAIGISITLLLISNENLLDRWNNVDSMFSGAILGLILLAFLFKHTSGRVALSASIISALFVAWLVVNPDWIHFTNLFDQQFNMIAAALVFLTLGIMSLLSKNTKK